MKRILLYLSLLLAAWSPLLAQVAIPASRITGILEPARLPASTLTEEGAVSLDGLVNQRVYQSKRLSNRLYASTRAQSSEANFATVADMAALAALTVTEANYNNRFVRVSSTGGLYMAQAEGSGLDKWTSALAPVVQWGDSMGLLNWTPLYHAAWDIHVFGGYIGFNADFGGMRLSAGATLHNQAAGEGIPSDYAIAPDGRWVEMPSGESVTWGRPTAKFANQIGKIYYHRESGGGEFKVQTRLLGGEWADVVGYTAIDADGAAGTQAITINTGTKDLREWRVVGVSGTVKIVRAGAFNERGIAFADQTYGGIKLAHSVLWPAASMQTMWDDLAPCLVTMEHKDEFAGSYSEYASALTAFEALLTSAGQAAEVDVLYVGTSVDDITPPITEQNAISYAHARAFGRGYVDTYSAGESLAAMQAAFNTQDAIHLYGAAKSYTSAVLARAIGLVPDPLETRSQAWQALAVTDDVTLRAQSLRRALLDLASAPKLTRGGLLTEGTKFGFASVPTIGAGDFTWSTWLLVPPVGSGARDFLGLAASNITTNVAERLAVSVDQGTDTLIVSLNNAANNGERRQNISNFFTLYAGKVIMLTIRRSGGRLTVAIDEEPCGDRYEYRAASASDPYVGYTESTNGTSPPAWSGNIANTALQIYGGATTRWAAPVLESAFYTSALTDSQIAAYRYSGIAPSGAAGLWTFEENSGRYSYDRSGNARTMTTTTTSVQVWDLWYQTGRLTASAARNSTTSAYAAGTAYALTNTAAALDFGTTDPTITLSQAGTYSLRARVQIKANAATIAGETVTLKLRRTNNTAADLTGGSTTYAPEALTTTTQSLSVVTLPEIIYTTTATNDAVTIFGNVSAALGAGTIDATEASIVAVRLY